MHFTSSDDKQRFQNVVSHDSLNKLKVLNGGGRICDRLISSPSVSFLWFFSFSLRLPISNLSALPAMD